MSFMRSLGSWVETTTTMAEKKEKERDMLIELLKNDDADKTIYSTLFAVPSAVPFRSLLACEL